MQDRAGYADGYTYKQEDETSCASRYVGGIVGYGEQSVLYDCETEANGYVLGSPSMSAASSVRWIGLIRRRHCSVKTAPEQPLTQSYVIGNSYVSGIIGENKGGSTIKLQINTGVVAGYNVFIGGIAVQMRTMRPSPNCAKLCFGHQ